MRFSTRSSAAEDPEINLIPMIDVLLVILIFLMVTTSYSKVAGLDINLPTATTNQQTPEKNNIEVFVSSSGDVLVDRNAVGSPDVDRLRAALLAASAGNNNPLVTINADAKATHQSVINVMQAAQLAGFGRLTFTVQTKPQ